jgi:streptogramin lyase
VPGEGVVDVAADAGPIRGLEARPPRSLERRETRPDARLRSSRVAGNPGGFVPCDTLQSLRRTSAFGPSLRRRDLLTTGVIGGLGWCLGVSPQPSAAEAPPKGRPIQLPRLHRVPLGIKTGRLHEVQPSDDGCLWFWTGVGDLLIRYDPRTGKVERHRLVAEERPELHKEFIGRHFFPLGKGGKIYLSDIRMASRHLPVYHPDTRRVTFAPLPAPAPEKPLFLYKGLAPEHGPYLYLFVKEPPGVIQWDPRSDTGEVFPYPYGAAGPWFGDLAADGKTLWCPLWDANALARLDVTTGKWTGHWPSPHRRAQPTGAGLIGPCYYSPDLLEPRLLIFDTVAERWGPPVAVPGQGKEFGILAGGLIYNQRVYCALNTYKGYIPPGGPLGVDGKPHHFLDRWLCYDPQAEQLAHLVCRGTEGEYWLTCYGAVSGKHLYLTAFHAMDQDGTIGQGRLGEAAVFQTHPQGHPEADPELEDVPVWEPRRGTGPT